MKNTKKTFKGFSKLLGNLNRARTVKGSLLIIAITALIVSVLAGCVSYSVQSVAISPTNNATQIKAGETLQFNFSVEASGKDTSKSQVVKWAVSSTADGKGPVISGTAINTSGLLTVSANEIYPVLYVTASHAVFSSQKDQKQIKVSGPKVGSVVLSTAASSVVVGKTVKLSAFVAGLAPNQGLTYSVGSKNDGTGAVVAGTAIASDGTLTVATGETSPSLYVRAVSTSDKTKFDVKEIKVVSVTNVAVSAEGGPARVLRGAKLKFNAAVTGVNNPSTAVTWKVSLKNDGTGDVTAGTVIASDGTLTVAAAEAAATLYVIATSSIVTTKSGFIAVTIPTVNTVTVTPATPQVKRGDGATFTAKVAGTGDPSQNVTWKLDGIGGTTSVTSITNNGTLIISTAETLSQLLITATSVDDPTKSGSTVITIPAVPAAVVAVAPTAQATVPSTQTVTPAATATTTPTATTPAATLTPAVVGTEGLRYDLINSGAAYSVSKGTVKSGAVVIPPSYQNKPVKEIAAQAFEKSDITSITIPDSVTNIGRTAFWICTKLTSVTLGSGVTSIDGTAFNGCSSLTAITVAAANTAYTSDNGILYNKNKTAIVTYSGGKTGAFTIPNNVTVIQVAAFAYCEKLTGITIPNSVTKIENGAFAYCKGLTSVTVPDSVTKIEQNTFSGCSGLTSVTLGSGITSIGFGAFSNCTKLTTINIPNGVTAIEAWAFAYDEKLTGITLPNSLTKIGDGAFFGPNSITNLNIPARVTSIGFQNGGAFNVCEALPAITVDAANTAYAAEDGVLYNKAKTTLLSCPAGKTGSLVIPNSVKDINKDAFQVTQLSSITIPSSVTSIPSGLLTYALLTSVTFVGTIPSSAFANDAFNTSWGSGLGDLRDKFYATDKANGTPGTYTRPDTKSKVWTKQ